MGNSDLFCSRGPSKGTAANPSPLCPVGVSWSGICNRSHRLSGRSFLNLGEIKDWEVKEKIMPVHFFFYLFYFFLFALFPPLFFVSF